MWRLLEQSAFASLSPRHWSSKRNAGHPATCNLPMRFADTWKWRARLNQKTAMDHVSDAGWVQSTFSTSSTASIIRPESAGWLFPTSPSWEVISDQRKAPHDLEHGSSNRWIFASEPYGASLRLDGGRRVYKRRLTFRWGFQYGMGGGRVRAGVPIQWCSRRALH